MIHTKAIALLRALTIDLGDGPHDLVDEMNGRDVVVSEATSLLASMGLSPVSSDLIPSPDDAALTDVYRAAIEVATGEVVPAPDGLMAVVLDILAYEEPEEDGDIVEAFSEFQARIKAEMVPEFIPPTVGAVEVIKALQGAVSSLDHQVGQMRGMFGGDSSIQEAVDDGDEADALATSYLKSFAEGPARIIVTVDGGIVQDAGADRDLPGLQIIVIDYDMEGDEDLFLLVDNGTPDAPDWVKARGNVFGEVTPDVAHLEPSPLTASKLATVRAPTEEEIEAGQGDGE